MRSYGNQSALSTIEKSRVLTNSMETVYCERIETKLITRHRPSFAVYCKSATFKDRQLDNGSAFGNVHVLLLSSVNCCAVY